MKYIGKSGEMEKSLDFFEFNAEEMNRLTRKAPRYSSS